MKKFTFNNHPNFTDSLLHYSISVSLSIEMTRPFSSTKWESISSACLLIFVDDIIITRNRDDFLELSHLSAIRQIHYEGSWSTSLFPRYTVPQSVWWHDTILKQVYCKATSKVWLIRRQSHLHPSGLQNIPLCIWGSLSTNGGGPTICNNDPTINLFRSYFGESIYASTSPFSSSRYQAHLLIVCSDVYQTWFLTP